MHEQDEVATDQLPAEVPAAAPPVQAQAPVAPPSRPLASEEIVVSAPLSFHGSAARIWRPLSCNAGATDNGWATFGWYLLAYTLIALAWVGVLCWYLIFGLLVVPYRLIRRGQRKRKLEEARHRELMSAQQGQVNQ
jgi:hypothetical protein